MDDIIQKEKEVLKATVDLWQQLLTLENSTREIDELRMAVHRIQDIMCTRIVRKALPEILR